MFVAIMILIIMIFVSQLLGFEYLKLEIRKAVTKNAEKRENAYSAGYADGYSEGYKNNYHAKFISRVREEGYITARKNGK